MKRLVSIIVMLCVFDVLGSAAAKHGNINVVILGDSNTSIGGDECDKPKGWNKWFREYFEPATCRSYARSGATWTNTSSTKYDVKEYTEKLSNNNVIYNQVNRLVEACRLGKQVEPQLILIAAGTNDAWFGTSRPGRYSKTAQQVFDGKTSMMPKTPASKLISLAESVRYVCEMLMKNFPDAQIILLTPMQSTAVKASDIRKVGDIIEQCGRYMSINVIRQDYGSSVYHVRERAVKTYTTDGTHTSEKGARRNGIYIANRVEALLQM